MSARRIVAALLLLAAPSAAQVTRLADEVRPLAYTSDATPPAGTSTELQFRLGAVSFGAVAGSAVTAGTGALTLTSQGAAVTPLTLVPHAGQTAPLIGIGSSATGYAEPALIMPAYDATVGPVGLWMGATTFSLTRDPIIFWGYNHRAEKASHPRIYWGLEGYYNDGSHIWSETYVEKWDSDGTHSRPIVLGTYDGFADTAYYVSSFGVNLRTGTSAGEATYAAGFSCVAGTPQTCRVAPSTTLYVARGVGDTTDAVHLINSSSASVWKLTSAGTIERSLGGQLLWAGDADGASAMSVFLGRQSTDTPNRWLSWRGNAFESISASYPAIIARGYTGQTANIVEVTDVDTNVLAAVSANGSGYFRTHVEAVTATKSPSSAETGEAYTNEGDSDGATITLPSAVAGLTYTAIVQAAQTLTVTAAAGDTIRIAASVTAAAGSITSATAGSTVTLLAINATEWVSVATNGAWAF